MWLELIRDNKTDNTRPCIGEGIGQKEAEG